MRERAPYGAFRSDFSPANTTNTNTARTWTKKLAKLKPPSKGRFEATTLWHFDAAQ
jgi:hypothetical protein